MNEGTETRLEGMTLVVRIPMRFQRRGGRKRIVAPDGSEIAPTTKPQPDGTLVKALARAWRRQRMLDEGRYSSVSEISEAEGINKLRQPDPAAGTAGARHRRGDPGWAISSDTDAGEARAVAARELGGTTRVPATAGEARSRADPVDAGRESTLA
jgi:hypothetical protein